MNIGRVQETNGKNIKHRKLVMVIKSYTRKNGVRVIVDEKIKILVIDKAGSVKVQLNHISQ